MLLTIQLIRVDPVLLLNQHNQEALWDHANDVASAVKHWKHVEGFFEDVAEVLNADDTLDCQDKIGHNLGRHHLALSDWHMVSEQWQVLSTQGSFVKRLREDFADSD